MNWRINSIFFLLVIIACKQEQTVDINTIEDDYLIEAYELKAIIDKSQIKIIDFRKENIYNNEHIDGALNIWRTDIENDLYSYKGMMPSKSQLELLFGKLGIETKDTLVIYDDNGLCEATRLWWILQNYDFNNTKLLHGGINAWKTIGGSVSTEIPVVRETVFKLPDNPKMQYYASKELVQEALIDSTIIIDTRTHDEFSGRRQKKGAARSGRIPNSTHIDWVEAVRYNDDKRIKSITDLEVIYSKLNVTKNHPIIVYCHSGVRSAHTSFVLTQLLGYKNVKNYDGSWTEWSYFNNLPVERDSITQINK